MDDWSPHLLFSEWEESSLKKLIVGLSQRSLFPIHSEGFFPFLAHHRTWPSYWLSPIYDIHLKRMVISFIQFVATRIELVNPHINIQIDEGNG
jgi:hypothetical protein